MPFNLVRQAVSFTFNRLLNASARHRRIDEPEQIIYEATIIHNTVIETSIMAHSRTLTHISHDQAIVTSAWHIGQVPSCECSDTKLHLHVDLLLQGIEVCEVHVYPLGLQLRDHMSETDLAVYTQAVGLVVMSSPFGWFLRTMYDLQAHKKDILIQRIVQHHQKVAFGNLKLVPHGRDYGRWVFKERDDPEPTYQASTPEENPQFTAASSEVAGAASISVDRVHPMFDEQAPTISSTYLSREVEVIRQQVATEQQEEDEMTAPTLSQPEQEYPVDLRQREKVFYEKHPDDSMHASDAFPPFTAASTPVSGMLPPYATQRGFLIDRVTKLAVSRPSSVIASEYAPSTMRGFGDDNLTVVGDGLRDDMAAEIKSYKNEWSAIPGPNGSRETTPMTSQWDDMSSSTVSSMAVSISADPLPFNSLWRDVRESKVLHPTNRTEPAEHMARVRSGKGIAKSKIDKMEIFDDDDDAATVVARR